MRIIQPEAGLQRQTRNPFSEIGRLAVGYTDKTNPQKTFPCATDYFVVRGEQAETFTERYGDKPQSLAIRFASDDPEFSCSERYELRDGAGKLFGFGNGQEFWFFDTQEKTYSTYRNLTEKPNVMAETVAFLTKGMPEHKAKNIGWKQVLYVRFLITDFPMLGYWQFMTQGAKSSIPAIRDTFDNCLKTFGSVTQIPFSLQVKRVKSNNPGQAKRFSIVSLIPMISLEEGFKLSAARPQGMAQLAPVIHDEDGVVYELPEGIEDDTGEDQEQAEYQTQPQPNETVAQLIVHPVAQTAPVETVTTAPPEVKATPVLTPIRKPGNTRGFPANAGGGFHEKTGAYDKKAVNGFAAEV